MKPLAKALLIVLPLALAPGCGSDEKTIETPEGSIQINKDENKVVITDESGQTMRAEMGENVSLPAGFPKDVPLYPKAKLLSSISMGEGTMLMLESRASPQDVMSFYKEKLAKQGWKQEAEMNMGGQRMSTYSKGERGISVTAHASENGTQLSLTLGQPAG